MPNKKPCDDPERKRQDLQVLRLSLDGAPLSHCAEVAQTLSSTVELRQQRAAKQLRRLYLADAREDRPALDISVPALPNKARRAHKDVWLTLIHRYGEQWINL